MDREIYDLAARLGSLLQQRGLMAATAESCTGGWIAQAITMVAGSSAWFDRAFVTYTFSSKRQMLGVRQETLDASGAVSEATVREMVQGALERSEAGIAVAVSGVAGPGGGSPDKPVGTVCFGWGMQDGVLRTETCRFDGDRDAVRRQSVMHALQGMLNLLRG